MMDYCSPKHAELLNVMNKINHQILCILLDYIYIFCLFVKIFKLKCVSKLQDIHALIKSFYVFEPTVHSITEDSWLSDLLGRGSRWRMRYFRSRWIPSEVKTRITKIFLDYFMICTICKLTYTLSLPLSPIQKPHLQTIHWTPPLLLQMSHI